MLAAEGEERLQRLVRAIDPQNRARWARQFAESGGRVIGILAPYVPEELITAAGFLPYAVAGTWREDTARARMYRPDMTCRYCSHVLESVLTGQLDFLHGVVSVPMDDDFKRLWDVIGYLGKYRFTHIIHLPHVQNEITLGLWIESLREFKSCLEQAAGNAIDPQALEQATETHNGTRRLLRQLYELGKRDVPPLSGAEAMAIASASRIMPREEFNRELAELLPYVAARETGSTKRKCRLLVASDYLDNPDYIKLVEGSEAVVVTDDLDVGTRYLGDAVDASSGDLLAALGRRYLLGPSCPRMSDWERQAHDLVERVREYRVDGVVELRQLYSLPRDFMHPYLKRKLGEAGVPYISLTREYHLSHVAALRTRVEAFVEMISAGTALGRAQRGD